MRFIGYLIRFFFPVIIPVMVLSDYILTGYLMTGGSPVPVWEHETVLGLFEPSTFNFACIFGGSLLLWILGSILVQLSEDDVPRLIALTDKLSFGLGLLVFFGLLLTLQIPILLLGAIPALLTGHILFLLPTLLFVPAVYFISLLTPPSVEAEKMYQRMYGR